MYAIHVGFPNGFLQFMIYAIYVHIFIYIYTIYVAFVNGFRQFIESGTPNWLPISKEGCERAQHGRREDTDRCSGGAAAWGPVLGHLEDSNSPLSEPSSETLLRKNTPRRPAR